MPEVLFQVQLAVKPTRYGEAELVPPKVLSSIGFSYVLVKDGGEEAIVKVSATSEELKKLGQRKACTRLTPAQGRQLRATYSAPRIKKRYRVNLRRSDPSDASPPDRFALDDGGKKIVDTFQTVRSGFYLIDVPISDEAESS